MRTNKVLLGEVAAVEVSGVDKKTHPLELPIKLCNFVDVYYNWAIDSFAIHKGQVAITKDSETRDDIGIATYIADNFDNVVLGYHCALITPQEDKLDGGYLNAILHTSYARVFFSNYASGSGQRYTLSADCIKQLPLYLPPIAYQRQVSSLFEQIDRKIKANKAINDNLEQQLRTIYDYWFTQFDFPDENGNPYRSSGGQMVYNQYANRFVPEHWKVTKLENSICRIATGLNPRDNFSLGQGEIKYITVKNLTSHGYIDFSGCDVVTEKARSIIHKRSDISIGDILFSSIAPLGRCYYIQSDPLSWDINESVFSLRVNRSMCSPEYLYMFLKSEDFVQRATSSSAGSIFKGIRINTLLDSYMVLPPKKIVDQFSQSISSHLLLQNRLNKEISYLQNLRDWLLPLLMNGQVTVEA